MFLCWGRGGVLWNVDDWIFFFFFFFMKKIWAKYSIFIEPLPRVKSLNWRYVEFLRIFTRFTRLAGKLDILHDHKILRFLLIFKTIWKFSQHRDIEKSEQTPKNATLVDVKTVVKLPIKFSYFGQGFSKAGIKLPHLSDIALLTNRSSKSRYKDDQPLIILLKDLFFNKNRSSIYITPDHIFEEVQK